MADLLSPNTNRPNLKSFLEDWFCWHGLFKLLHLCPLQLNLMSEITNKIYVVQRTIDNEIRLHSPLLFPEYSRLTPDAKLPVQFSERLHEMVSELANAERYQRIIGEAPTVEKVSVSLKPTKKLFEDQMWRNDLEIEFEVVVWRHANSMTIVYVPSLGIEILNERKFDDELRAVVRNEIFDCLQRNRTLYGLDRLAILDRFSETAIQEFSMTIDILSPKQEEESRKETGDPSETLKKVGSLLNGSGLSPAYELHSELESLTRFLFGTTPESVLVTGPAGVGKTSLLYELIRNQAALGLGEVEFWETSGSRLVAGMTGFGQWQERCQKMVDELRSRKAVLHVGNLFELVHVGKSVNQNRGIASFLRPYIERGQIRIVAECLPEQISLLEKEDPQLLTAFQKLEIKRPDRAKCYKILSSEAKRRTATNRIEVTESALQTIQQLHERYATYSSSPGRPIRFLRNLIDDSKGSTRLDSEQVTKKFASDTGLPYFLLSQKTPLQISDTENWLSQRVIGQQESVDLVVDMIAAVKSNMTPNGKPIASFLFIGPTGVGKTEMAKSIAEFMFSDSQKMIRFDMSEYSNLPSIERLIGGQSGCEGLLTSRVRQSPFSVLLLDEFEKAHPSFFDLLLQVLGEGRLTDSRGRVTDFSTSIVIMTSNLGAGSLKSAPFGFNREGDLALRTKEHFSREVQKFVRPELYNRIDRVVPFDPLSKETIRSVTRREMEKLRKREGLAFRPVNVSFNEESINWVADQGYDSRYGARPIQRFVQDQVVVRLSDKLNKYDVRTPVEVSIHVTASKLDIDAKAIQGNSDGSMPDRQPLANIPVAKSIIDIRSNRRRAQALFHCPLANRIRNEHFRLTQQFKKFERRQMQQIRNAQTAENREFLQKKLWERTEELAKYDEVMDSIASVMKTAMDQECEALAAYYRDQSGDPQSLAKLTFESRRRINEAIFKLFVFGSDDPEKTTVLLFGRQMRNVLSLLDAYQRVASDRNFKATCYLLMPYGARISDSDSKNNSFVSKGRLADQASPNGNLPNGQDSSDARSLRLSKAFSLKREMTGKEKLEEVDAVISVDQILLQRMLETPAKREKREREVSKLWVADAYQANLDDLRKRCPANALGIAVEFQGDATFPLFYGERGMHFFKKLNTQSVYIQVIGGSLVDHELPHESATNGPYERDEKRRTYNLVNQTIADQSFRESPYSNFDEGVARILEDNFQRHLDTMLLGASEERSRIDFPKNIVSIVTN